MSHMVSVDVQDYEGRRYTRSELKSYVNSGGGPGLGSHFAIPFFPQSPISHMVSVDVRHYDSYEGRRYTRSELRSCVKREVIIPYPILPPVPYKPYGFCGRKVFFFHGTLRPQKTIRLGRDWEAQNGHSTFTQLLTSECVCSSSVLLYVHKNHEAY